MQYFSISLTPYLCNRVVRMDKCPCMFTRAFSSFQRMLYLCDDKSVVLLCRLMCMSEKLFCFLQMNDANEKSFRSIRRNEWTQCSLRLRRHWSRPIEHGEISLSHLLRTIVPLILTCFCLHGWQLTPYVNCVSARFSQVTNLGDYWLGAFTALPKKKGKKRPLKRLVTGLHVALWDSCWGWAKVSFLLPKYSRDAATRYRKDRKCKFILIGPCDVQCLCPYCGVFVSLLSFRDYFSV